VKKRAHITVKMNYSKYTKINLKSTQLFCQMSCTHKHILTRLTGLSTYYCVFIITIIYGTLNTMGTDFKGF